MSYNTKRQRINLYKRTFLKWTPEQRLQTFTEVNAELSVAIAKFVKKPYDASFMKLCQTIGDVEVFIEIIEDTFDHVRPNIDKIKKDKLIQLMKTTGLKEEQETLNGKKQDLENLLTGEAKPSLFKRILKAPVKFVLYMIQSYKELKLYFS